MKVKWFGDLCIIFVLISLISFSLTSIYQLEMTRYSAEGSPTTTITGVTDDERFGWNVSSAGDINGDGYDDIIIGAPGYDNNRGRAFIFFGGSWLSGSLIEDNANVTFEGNAQGDRFGWDVSGAGDVNFDGFDDVIIGAPGNHSHSGAVYIFYGNGSFPSNINAIDANVTFLGEREGDNFGLSVSGAGDVNKDNFDDVIVGAPYHDEWWNGSWAYRRKLTFNNSDQSEDLMNFPILVNLSAVNLDYSKTKVDGSDLRFIAMDGVTELSYHIEEWNISGPSYVWVNVTKISGNSSSDYIWIYYGNSMASDVQDPSGTYDHSFVGIWHLKEDPGPGGIGDIKDATFNNNNGTAEASMASADLISGRIGYGIDFDGNDDYIDCGTGTSLDINNEITIEAWAKTNSDNFGTIASKHGNGDYGWIVRRSGITDSFGVIWSLDGINYINSETASDTCETDTWYHLVITFDGSVIRAYIDGREETGGDFPYSYGGLHVSATSTQIARDGYIGTDPMYMFDGILDEVRISNTARSAEWIKAQYLSMNNSFVTFSNEESMAVDYGASYIFYGNNSMPSSIDAPDANILMYGDDSGDKLGFCVSSACDLKNDGYDDIIIGAPGWNSNTGKAYVFHSENLSDDFNDGIIDPKWQFLNNEEGEFDETSHPGNLTISTSSLGEWWNSKNDAPTVYQNISGDFDVETELSATLTNNWEGAGIVIINDLDNFLTYQYRKRGSPNEIEVTYDETVDNVGNPIIDTTNLGQLPSIWLRLVRNGNVFTAYYKTSLPANWILVGETSQPYPSEIKIGLTSIYGIPFATFNDFNLKSGKTSLVKYTLMGQEPGDNFGYSVSNAGDRNNDSYDDVIIGAPGWNSDTGRAYIYYGSRVGMGAFISDDTQQQFNDPIPWQSDTEIGKDGTIHLTGKYIDEAFDNYSTEPTTPWIVLEESPKATVDMDATVYHGSSGQSVRFKDTGGPPQSERAIMYEDISITPVQATLIFEFSIRMGNNNTGNFYALIENKSTGNRAIEFCFSNAGIILCRNGTDWLNLMDYSADTWYNFKLTANVTSQTYNLYIDPDPIYPPTTLRMDTIGFFQTVDVLDYLGFATNTTEVLPDDAWVDDVKVYHYAALGIYVSGDLYLDTEDIFTVIPIWSEIDPNNALIIEVSGDGINWDTATSGSKITLTGPGSTLMYRAIFTSNGTYTPLLHEITIHYFTGSILTGNTVGDKFGHSVSSAEDMNNDGYTDVIIGAPGNAGYKGAVFVFYGNVSLPGIINATDANITRLGEKLNDKFGFSVSEAFDVNYNGYYEAIVGAPYYDDGLDRKAGRAYIFDYFAYLPAYQPDLWISGQTNDGYQIVPSGGQINTININAGQNATWWLVVQNDGDTEDTFNFNIIPTMFNGSWSWNIKENGTGNYIKNGDNVQLSPGGWKNYTLNISTPGNVIDGIVSWVIINISSQNDTSKRDAVKAIAIIRDSINPDITNVQASPDTQETNEYVNITCTVIDDMGVNEVWVNITLPEEGFNNVSLDQGIDNQWFYNNTYSSLGQFQYVIWVSDINGNWNKTLIYNFTILDTTLPLIFNILDAPDPQETGGYVNITCDATDNDKLGSVWINITLSGGGYINTTMSQGLGNQYFFNNTYLIEGLYQYVIWVSDPSNNWVSSSGFDFAIMDSCPQFTEPGLTPNFGDMDTLFNFTVNYSHSFNKEPLTITLNISGPYVGSFNLSEVDPLGNDYLNGKMYYCTISAMTIGSYSFHFAASDTNGKWVESEQLGFEVFNRIPSLSFPQVSPDSGYINTGFNFSVMYTDLDNHPPGTIVVNITGLGIYDLIEADTLDMNYTNGKLYYRNIAGIPVGSSYSYHFAANDILGDWAFETSEIDAPDVINRTATLTAIDEEVEYSDTAYLNATLLDGGSPISDETVGFYIDANKNAIYESGEFVANATTLADGSLSLIYSAYLVPDIYDFKAMFMGSGDYEVEDSFAHLIINAKQAQLTAVSDVAEEGEVKDLNAILIDWNGNPVPDENVNIYIDKNKNGIYEGNDFIGLRSTSASGVALITYTVNLPPGNYEIWARYMGSGNYSVIEIEGMLTVQISGNNPPTIVGIVPNQIKFEDSLPWTLALTPYESDIEDSGPDLKWYLTGIDNSLYSVTGENSTDDLLTFIPRHNAFGNNEVILWLEDKSGDLDSQVLWVNITPVNDHPYFNPEPPNLFVHYDDPITTFDDPSPWDITFYVHDVETPPDSLVIFTSEPNEDFGEGYVEVNGLNLTFHYPQNRIGDSILVTLTLSDRIDYTSTTIMVNVTSNWVPELIINLPDIIIKENSTLFGVFDLDDYFLDRDHDSIFFSSGYSNINVIINEDNTVDITAFEQWTGSELVTFRAQDQSGAIVEDTIKVTVINVNDWPVIHDAPDLIVHYDYSYAFDFTPYISDPDTPLNELSLRTSESTDNIWIQSHNNLGIIVNYPESMNGMTIEVTLFISDSEYTSSQEIHITISDNFPPELLYKLPDISFEEDTFIEDAILLSYYFLDIDGDALYFSNGTTFIEVNINNTDKTVDFTAPENWFGFESVTFRATDPTGSIAEDTILIVVVPVNDAPIIKTIPDQIKYEGEHWILDLSQYIYDVDNHLSELNITVVSNVGQEFITLTGNILVFQYPSGIQKDIVTIIVSDGDAETKINFTVNLKSKNQTLPSIWEQIPWYLYLLILFTSLGGIITLYRKNEYYFVHEAFLIHEKGLPITHVSQKNISDLEDVVVCGMFTILQNFINDTFSKKRNDEVWDVDEIKFGDNKIIIKRSKNIYLAAIFEGNGNRLGYRMNSILSNINKKYGEIFINWDGDKTHLLDISDMVAVLISPKGRKHKETKQTLDKKQRQIQLKELENLFIERKGMNLEDNKGIIPVKSEENLSDVNEYPAFTVDQEGDDTDFEKCRHQSTEEMDK